jgi:group I intron endonuclease
MAEVDTSMNASGIYKWVNLVNGKIYVGSAVKFRKRRDLHLLELRKNKHHSRYFQHAYNKYGEDKFKFEIVEFCEKENLEIREQFHLDTLKPDYNVCKRTDSRLGIKSSPDHIAKIAAANTGQKRSKETCEKIGAARRGTKLTEEQKQARRDYRHSAETRALISKVQIGRKHTEEAKLKMSLSKKKNTEIKNRPYLTQAPIILG